MKHALVTSLNRVGLLVVVVSSPSVLAVSAQSAIQEGLTYGC